MTDDKSRLANLNYWAYWIGELAGDQYTDTFMLNAETGSWSGNRLFSHLIRRIDPRAPHLTLNLQSMHTLVASRPGVLNTSPELLPSFSEALEKLASTRDLTRPERDQVTGLHYALRIAQS